MTDIVVVFNNEFTEMRESCNFEFSEKQDFVNAEDLTARYADPEKYGTLEYNRLLLDGTFNVFSDTPSDVVMGYMSLSLSGDTESTIDDTSYYAFETPIEITRSWEEAHSTEGVSITFDEESYCNYLNIEWFDSENNSLATQDFYPDSYNYKCEKAVSDFYSMKITFYGMNKANRYLRIYDFEDGKINKFSKNSTDKLIFVEFNVNCYPLALEVPSSTMNIQVVSDDLSYIQKFDSIDLYINNDYYMRYYIDKISYASSSIYEIYCIDILQYISELPQTYNLGYSSFLVDVISIGTLEEMIKNIIDFNLILSDEEKAKTLTGTILDTDSVLDVLQNLAIAYGLRINLIGSKKIVLQPIDDIIVRAEKKKQFANVSIEKDTMVSELKYEYISNFICANDGEDDTYTKLGNADPDTTTGIVDVVLTSENPIYKYKISANAGNVPSNIKISRIGLNSLRIYGTAVKYNGYYQNYFVYAAEAVRTTTEEYIKSENITNSFIISQTTYYFEMSIIGEISEFGDEILKYLNSSKIKFSNVFDGTLLNKKVNVTVDNKQVLCIPTSATCTWYGNKLKCEYEGLVIEE